MGNCASTEVPSSAQSTNIESKPQAKPESQGSNGSATNSAHTTKASGDGVTTVTVANENLAETPLDPVDLEFDAPRPTTASPHALPRLEEEEDLFDARETQTLLHPFRNGVAKITSQKRIWSRLASELDAAEELDLLAKVEFHRSLETEPKDQTETLECSTIKTDQQQLEKKLEQSNSATPTSRSKAINGPKITTKERLAKRRAYQRQIEQHNIIEADTYPEQVYAGDEYLWNLSLSQHKCRAASQDQPHGPGALLNKNGRQFDIANVPDLNDDTPITEEWIKRLGIEFRAGKILSHKNAFQLTRMVATSLMKEENCPTLRVHRDSTCTVVGDLHGQLDDLLMIFREAGTPSKTHHMLFNGDFVDRGAYSTEIIWMLFAYRILYPDRVHLNRGNHECSDMNAFDGFLKECELKYTKDLYTFVNHAFAAIPIAHVVGVGQQRVFVVHAGLSFEDITVDEVNAENRFLTSFPMNSILQDLLWSDPFDGVGRKLSRRGAGCMFGIDVVQNFLIKNNIHLIIRSHEMEDNGFALFFSNRLYTIFSASNYCSSDTYEGEGNYGAFCVLSQAPSPQIRVFSAKQQVVKYSERQIRIRQALLAKLLVRIASRISQIEKELIRIADARGTPNFVPPFAWSFALTTVLGLDVAYLPLAVKLGVNVDSNGKLISESLLASEHLSSVYTAPYSDDDRATHQLTFIKTEGAVASLSDEGKVLIDISTWIDKFRPKALANDDLKGRIASMLYDTTSPFRSGIESLFSHFDLNGDGFITADELSNGLTRLFALLDLDQSVITPEAVDALLDDVDIDRDGEIDWQEFYSAFAFGTLDIKATPL